MREQAGELRKDYQPDLPAHHPESEAETIGLADTEALQRLLLQYADKRVIVLGPPGVGKTTILRHIPGAQDMDEILFPQLSPQEKAIVFQKPWTPEAGEEMRRLACAKIVVSPGQPVFATVVLDAAAFATQRARKKAAGPRAKFRAAKAAAFQMSLMVNILYHSREPT